MEAIAKREDGYGIVNFDETAMSVSAVVKQVQIIQSVMKEVMKKDEHYGVIPGTEKPSLLKPGAEKLGLTFRLAPEYDVTVVNLPRDHREYQIRCRLYHIPTGAMVGQGVGTCSTMESKWRYLSDYEWTGRAVPKAYWDKRDIALLGGKGFVAKKNAESQWEIAKIAGKVERDNPADTYNTCEKMAKKRAHVDAILTATAASDIFTQDLEEIVENEAHTDRSSNGQQSSAKKQKEETESHPASEAQLKRIGMLMTDCGYDDITRHAHASEIAGIPATITSMKELTVTQASKVIECLIAEKKEMTGGTTNAHDTVQK
jgi:hypothetical protein